VEHALSAGYLPAQAIYDLRKLRGKGLLERVEGRRRYRITSEGLRVATVLSKLKDSLFEPVLRTPNRTRRRRRRPSTYPLPPPDCYFRGVEELLDELCEFLELHPAA